MLESLYYVPESDDDPSDLEAVDPRLESPRAVRPEGDEDSQRPENDQGCEMQYICPSVNQRHPHISMQ